MYEQWRSIVRAVAGSQFLPAVLVLWGVASISFLYGSFAKEHHTFPSSQVDSAALALKGLLRKTSRAGDPIVYFPSKESRTVVVHQPGAVAPGLTLISGIGGKGALFAKLIDVNGRVVHAWDLDWFRLWPHADYLPPDVRPKSRPGTHIHGMVLEPNGDLVFNYEELGMMKVDVCGRPLWRLPRRTHHSIVRDDDGNYWAPELVESKTPLATLPNYKPPLFLYSVLEVSPEGRVLREIPIIDLLMRNGYSGLLYMQSTSQFSTAASDDMLHMNDVDVFPKSMAEGAFKHGDIMVSLRNINAVVVFDPQTLLIKTAIVGRFVRQHDPDFDDGWNISVFDNNNVTSSPGNGSSRIASYSVKYDRVDTIYQGTPEHPFYSIIMGKHQRLPNGDILIAEAMKGRVFEVSPSKQIIWEYFNQTGDKGMLGLMEDAQRIPPDFISESKIEELAERCHVS